MLCAICLVVLSMKRHENYIRSNNSIAFYFYVCLVCLILHFLGLGNNSHIAKHTRHLPRVVPCAGYQ